MITDIIGPLLPPTEPELRAIFITSLNGSITVDGRSGALGNDTDRALLLAMRDWSDVVLAGAHTVTAENYGGVVTSPEVSAARVAEGRPPVPRLAVVTRSLRLDPESRFFREATTPPLVLIPGSSFTDPDLAAQRDRLTAAGAEIHSTGDGSPAEIVRVLHGLGLPRISCEGGPALFSEVLRAGLVDVLHLTVAPVIHAPVEKQLAHDVHTRFTLDRHLATDDGTLFLRLRRPGTGLR